MNPVVRRVLRTQYVLIRTPLAVLDRRVLSRLPDDSRVRTTVAQGLAGLDVVASRLTSDQGQDGGSVDRTAQDGGQDQPTADARADAAREEREEQERIAAALLDEEQLQQHVGELADADEAELQRQADQRARHLLAEKADEEEAKKRQAAVQERDSRAAKVPGRGPADTA
jgi:hypothetical protein